MVSNLIIYFQFNKKLWKSVHFRFTQFVVHVGLGYYCIMRFCPSGTNVSLHLVISFLLDVFKS